MNQIIPQSIGVTGMICVVYAYLAIEKGWVDRNQRRYYMINLVGAVLLTISLLFNFNLGSFLIEMFWIWISIAGLIRIKKENLE
jgi:MFS family permease